MSAPLLWLLPLLPVLLGFGLLCAGRRVDPAAGPVAILVQAAATLGAGALLLEPQAVAIPWMPFGAGMLQLHLATAGVGAPGAALVAAAALVTFVYAYSQLGRGEARGRFFGWMLVFSGAMVWVVLAADLLTLLLGWELIGVASWALIGFWHREPERVRAAGRAFIATRAGDLGIYLAAAAIYSAGAGRFDALGALPPWVAEVAAGGLILAAAGKSAQLPFSGWLAGAMLGPSPVSALIHSATLVAAGAVLLIKAHPLVSAVPWAGPLLLYLGLGTALAGALIALFQEELKPLLAASTCSQLGLVFAGIGSGGFAEAATHLANHAAFKGALFLAAGVLLARGLKRLSQMGGVLERLPVTAALTAVGLAALAALPPLGGFFSKAGLYGSVARNDAGAGWLFLAASALTAAYAARVWLGAFVGEPRTIAAGFAREPGLAQRGAMAILALGAVLLGAAALDPFTAGMAARLGTASPAAAAWHEITLSLIASAIGIAWAYALHRLDALVEQGGRERQAQRWFGLTALLDGSGRLALALGRALARLEPGAGAGVGRLVRAGARGAALADDHLFSVGMPGWAGLARLLGALARLGDRSVIDAFLSGLVGAFDAATRAVSRLQDGRIAGYYGAFALGAALLVAGAWWAIAGGSTA